MQFLRNEFSNIFEDLFTMILPEKVTHIYDRKKLHWCTALKVRYWPYCGAHWHLKFLSLALLRCKTTLKFFKLGLIAVQNDFWNFRSWPYGGSNWLSKFSSLVLLRCKVTFEIFELGLIAVQNDFKIFRAWPYCGTKWLPKFLSLALLRCK